MAVGMGVLAIVSRHMPRKTAKGAEEAAKWLAFKQYLENIDKYSDMESVKEQFQVYLPYAVAFGLEKRLISKFSAVDAPAPTWWGPVTAVWWPRLLPSGSGCRACNSQQGAHRGNVGW
jgi:hypothetical protein